MDALHLIWVMRQRLGQLNQRLVAEYLERGKVAALRLTVAEKIQFAQDSVLLRCELWSPVQKAPETIGIRCAWGRRHLGHACKALPSRG